MAITGRELDRLSDEELHDRIDDISVFARVSPEHKMRLVERAPGTRRGGGHDRRRRQRRPRAAPRRHGDRHGHHRHGGDEGGRHHGAGRRQLRHHRRGRPPRPDDLRQHREVRALPAEHDARLRVHLPDRLGARHRRRPAVHRHRHPVGEHHHGRPTGHGPRPRPGGRDRDGPPPAAPGRAHPHPPAVGGDRDRRGGHGGRHPGRPVLRARAPMPGRARRRSPARWRSTPSCCSSSSTS